MLVLMTDSFRRLSKSVVRISLHRSEDFTWRVCFVFPAALHLVLGLVTLRGRG